MSQYDPVTPERLRQFLTRLGRDYRQSGRVLLVGGTGLIYQQLKAATKDVDLSTQFQPAEEDRFGQVVRRLSRELNMAIEIVSPANFIPLPRGVEERHRYLGREGQLEIFAFDPVSTALAKIARGRAGDLADVLALVTAGHLSIDAITAAYDEILPRVAAGQALKIGPDEYRQKMDAFLVAAQVRGLIQQQQVGDVRGDTSESRQIQLAPSHERSTPDAVQEQNEDAT